MKGREVLLRHGIPKSDELCRAWVKLIESEQLLRLDAPFPGVLSNVEHLAAEGIGLHICTARQREDLVLRQLTFVGLAQLVRSVHVVHLDGCGRSLARKACLTAGLGLSAVVGDTEVDREWAIELGATFLALSCGLRSREFWLARGIEPHSDMASAVRNFVAWEAGQTRRAGANADLDGGPAFQPTPQRKC